MQKRVTRGDAAAVVAAQAARAAAETAPVAGGAWSVAAMEVQMRDGVTFKRAAQLRRGDVLRSDLAYAASGTRVLQVILGGRLHCRSLYRKGVEGFAPMPGPIAVYSTGQRLALTKACTAAEVGERHGCTYDFRELGKSVEPGRDYVVASRFDAETRAQGGCGHRSCLEVSMIVAATQCEPVFHVVTDGGVYFVRNVDAKVELPCPGV